MILAGIDEAGYGPLLGPLVVGCCAFEVEPDGEGRPPCLWQVLRKHVGKARDRTGRRIHVNDSKLVYSPAGGLKELERALLALVASQGAWPADLSALLAHVASDAIDDLAGYAWYETPADEAFPLEQAALPIRLFAKAFRAEMDRSKARCVHLAARVVCERQFNRMCDATRNKSNVLFSTAAIHLDHLLRTYGQQDLVIVCDRQGGRSHYGGLLRLMFEEWALEIVEETDGRSEYRMTRAGHAARITFTEKAEAQCLPVAVASMLSKYLREALMRRLNAYWRRHLPDVQPTAGYYSDGVRFLKDIDAARQALAIADGDFIRSR